MNAARFVLVKYFVDSFSHGAPARSVQVEVAKATSLAGGWPSPLVRALGGTFVVPTCIGENLWGSFDPISAAHCVLNSNALLLSKIDNLQF